MIWFWLAGLFNLLRRSLAFLHLFCLVASDMKWPLSSYTTCNECPPECNFLWFSHHTASPLPAPSWTLKGLRWSSPVGWPQNPLSSWGQKSFFCAAFRQEWHLPPQHSGFGPKLSSTCKPASCALLETLLSPVVFFRRAKLLGQLHCTSFVLCRHIFGTKDDLFTLRHTRDGQLSKKSSKTFLWLAVT